VIISKDIIMMIWIIKGWAPCMGGFWNWSP